MLIRVKEMKINQKMVDALNGQINRELYSAYLYLGMSAYFESENLHGFAKWVRVQAGEERVHAMKFFDYIVERGGEVRLAPIDAPPTEWKSPLAAVENIYEHEQKVTAWIHELLELAMDEKDYATANMLQWFVSEQVEEEANAFDLVHKTKMLAGHGHALLCLDEELGKRE
ncbi:MAG: ferritin [Methanomicrobiales archaeon]|nr:ferritin [Methanomicrobiales archaeon]